MSLTGTPSFLGQRTADLPAISQAEEDSLLAKLGRQGGQFVSDLLWGLDTPGAVIRSGIDYLQDGKWNNPLDADQRVSGEQLLDNAGVPAGTARWLGGAATDIVLDPLTWLGGPMTALTKGGRAAKAIGTLDEAAEVASRKLQDAAIAGRTPIAGRAQRTLDAMDSNIEDYIEHSARPLVGQRVAMRQQTLEDLMQGKDQKTFDALNAFLEKKGWKYDDIKGEKLGKSFGVAGTPIAFDPLGSAAGERLAAGMDRVGESIRWSKPGLVAHSIFNKAVGGQTDAITQAAATRINAAAEVGESRGRVAAADMAHDLTNAKIDDAVAQRTGISGVFTPEAADAMDRYIEGVAATANDIDFVNSTPGVKAFIDKWGAQAPDILRRSEEMGLRAHQLDHAYGANYRPYQMESLLERAAGGKKGKTALFDMATGDMLKRKKSLQLPGGLDQLRALSQDPRFVGLGDAFQEDRVAQELFDEINNPNSAYYLKMASSPVGQAAAGAGGQTANYSKAKARQLAKFLHGLDVVKDAQGNITSGPVFGNNPLEAVARYTVGRERAIDTADAVIDTIASRLVQGTAGGMQGGKHISAKNALARAGLRSPLDPATNIRGGAAQQLRERIAAKLTKTTGQTVNPDTIDLAHYAISEDAINSLTRMHDFYAQPKAVEGLSQYLDQYTKVFKAQVLTWPSRFTRDSMSGFVSNSIEAGPAAALEGTMQAASLLEGKYDKVMPYIRRMPLYSHYTTNEEALKQFLLDSAEAKILRGGSITDVMAGDRSAASIQKLLPGQTPQSIVGSINYDPTRSWGTALNPFGVRGVAGRKDTTNAIYKTGEALGDYTDSLNRMAGYMALLQSGVSPQEAARRMGAAHVLYDNLSTVERQLRDRWMPFYAYSSRIGKYVVERMAERPGGPYGQMLKLVDKAQQTDDDTYVPQTMREQTGFAIPKELGAFTEAMGLGNVAEPNPGVRRFVKNLDLPGLSVLNLLSTAKTGGEFDANASIVSTIQNVGQQLAPHLRSGIELLTQQDMHTKRKLGEVPSELDTIIGAATGNEDFRLPSAVNSAVDIAAPGASRVLSLGRQIADPRIENVGERVGQALFNQVSPVRFGLVDEKRQRNDAIRQLDEELGRTPQARTMEITSIAKDDFDKLTPEMQKYYLLRQQLQKKNRAESKKREDAQKRAARFSGFSAQSALLQ